MIDKEHLIHIVLAMYFDLLNPNSSRVINFQVIKKKALKFTARPTCA